MLTTGKERYIGNLYENYGSVLKSFLVRRYGSEDFANEVSQETFCTACEKRTELSVHPCPQGWLYRTAENKAREMNRRRLRIAFYEVGQEDNISAPCGKFSEIETKEVLRVALSAGDHRMLLLRYDMEYNYRELSHIYGISEDACKKRVYRSIFRVRNYMKK